MPDTDEKSASRYYGQMIPVHVELTSTQVVLAQPEMRDLLAGAELIALGDCGCRKEAAVCDHPLDVCLAVDDEARDEMQKHAWREISLDEALRVLERSHRAGLVHIAYRKPGAPVTLICSCCACACGPLRRLKGRDYREEITESAYVARFDAAVCAGCGRCVERCPFGAFQWNGSDRPAFRATACFGCGLCVSTCPAGAVGFARR
jgi:NAD-dependent dihydropyrimidine dehydrogenase PreA subunit